MKRAVVVEDEARIRANLIYFLQEDGFEVKAFEAAEPALAYLEKEKPQLLLVDVRLPEMSGVDLCRSLMESDRLPPTIVVSGEATISETVEALRLGVYDFIEKPFTRERLLRSVRNCLDHLALKDQVRSLEIRLAGGKPMLGRSPAMKRLQGQIQKVAPTQGRVLILGQSGAGKELVANAIHQSSPRAKGPFIKINCAALPSNLIEDELFGHVRGAFTDARMDKPGLFEEAHGGTLFLDEIGDMDMALQTRLLRVLEDGKVRRIGASRETQVDVRVLCATHRDLNLMVEQGEFRQDLFFRISALPIQVPSLSERVEDVPLLMEFFVQTFCRENHMRIKSIDPSVFQALGMYTWPGNIRELRNLCEQLVVFGGDPILAESLPPRYLKAGSAPEGSQQLPSSAGGGELDLRPYLNLSLKDFRRLCEREFIKLTLDAVDGNYTEAARRLDIQRTYLYQKANQLDL
ncbi:MAG: sigma-54-dependent Fis family transcriptional regulator [Acidobacteria bacterium]|nr:sigma-54-dependent Fis family transcriptional regulator [Acidobacteriota bacterium]